MSRAAIRAALVSLLIGTAIGGALLASPPGRAGSLLRWLPLHVELLLIGWLAQLGFGVAYWILPRLPGRPAERGRFVGALVAFLLLNAGAWTAGLGPALGLPSLVLAGRAAELAGASSFAWHAAPRIRGASSRR